MLILANEGGYCRAKKSFFDPAANVGCMIKPFEVRRFRFFTSKSRDIGLLLSSMASFVASTRLIRSGVAAIDSPDQSRQIFDQHATSELWSENCLLLAVIQMGIFEK